MLEILHRDTDEEGVFRAVAMNLGEELGFVEYDYEVKKDTYFPFRVRIIRISSPLEDRALIDGMLRAVLFKSALKGIDKAVYSEKSREIAFSLGLCDCSGELISIESILGGCEKCKKSC